MSRRLAPPSSEATLSGSFLDDPEVRAQLVNELSETGSGTRGLVLVVEAEGEARERRPAAAALEAAGFRVRSTSNGVAGSQWLATSRFDAVVTDVFVPELGGIDLLRYAREHDADIPVLLMTAAPDVESAAQAVEHGAFQYLLKPLAEERLVAAVDKAVQACRAARARSAAFAAIEDPTTQQGVNEDGLRRWRDALGSLWMAYQPIVLPGGKLYAYEALVRSEEPSLAGAGPILDMAEALNDLVSLGRTVRARVGENAARAAGGHYLFVNLHADDLLDETLAAPDGLLAQIAPTVVLEITERAALHDIDEARAKMAELRSMGFRIALDDLGAGYAGLTSFAELRPDIVKLDMALVRHIDTDNVKRKLVRSVVDVSRDMGTLVVGEGVETAAERDVLVELGCHLLQGFLFGKPARIY